MRTATQNAQTGYLPEDRGHRVAWWAWGNPEAPALLLLHGGPGGGISDGLRAVFDPEAWFLVAMDQRGCGASCPHAAYDLAALAANRTPDLIADCERLRAHLGVGAWAVYGGSWGASLAQAYAHAHPGAVRGMILVGVTQTSAAEIDWLYGHAGQLLPEAFAAFRQMAPEAAPGRGLVAAYGPLLRDPATAQGAADAWCAWEAAVIALDPRHAPGGRWADPAFRLGFARIVTHYFDALGWLDPLAEKAKALGDLPGEMVHSALDLSAPLATAWQLARDWPGARLTVLPGALHSVTEGAVGQAARAAGVRLQVRLGA